MPAGPTVAGLSASWRRASRALAGRRGDAASTTLAALGDELVARYAEPHRYYHTLQHLGECIAAFDDTLALAAHPGEVEAALWFHDAVYDVQAHDNETRSAAWAESALLDAGVAAAAVRRVHAHVMATRHEALPPSADARLVVDIDLGILGSAPARFDEYEIQVREEYAWVAEALFRERRRALLLRLLAQPSIYGTAHFRDRLERLARDNLRRSIRRLEG